MSKRHERERPGTMALPFHPSKRYNASYATEMKIY